MPSPAVLLVAVLLGAGTGAAPAPALADLLPAVRSHQKILQTDLPLTGTAVSRSGFSFALAALGDLEAQGGSTLAVGAHYKDGGGKERVGSIQILQLDTERNVSRVQEIAPGVGGLGAVLSPHDYFGFAVATAGDVDGDGIVDIAVGAPRDADGGEDAGAVYLLFLQADGRARQVRKISPRMPWARRAPWTWILPATVQGGFLADVPPFESLGLGLAGIGDLDGDGVPDLAVGARAGNEEDAFRGAVWVWFLRRDGTVREYRRIGLGQGGFDGVLHPDDGLGFGLAALGDLDGDGVTELAVGARSDDEGCLNCGAVWILFLDRDGTVRRTQKINTVHGGFRGRLNASAEFGAAIAALGDVDGDGVPDIAVGARGDDVAGVNTGAIWLLALNRDGTVKSERRIGVDDGGFTGTLRRHDYFGAGLAALGDPDGDGIPALAVGAEGDDEGVEGGGAVWVLDLGPANP